jgi:hypothetical protein
VEDSIKGKTLSAELANLTAGSLAQYEIGLLVGIRADVWREF